MAKRQGIKDRVTDNKALLKVQTYDALGLILLPFKSCPLFMK